MDDFLQEFVEATRRLRDDASDVNAQQAVDAARVAWAALYDNILLVGGFHREKLSAFRAALDQCETHLAALRRRNRVGPYKRQVAWYRHLTDLFRQRGVDAVNDAIQDAFDSVRDQARASV